MTVVNDAPAQQAADIGVAMGESRQAMRHVSLADFSFKVPVAMLPRMPPRSSCSITTLHPSPLPSRTAASSFDNLKKVVLYLVPCGSYT